jgi:hypothetical protein
MSLLRIPHPVSAISIRTAIQSNCALDSIERLCSVRRPVNGDGGWLGPARDWVSTSFDGFPSSCGNTRRVDTLSLPPARVNLHALLLRRAQKRMDDAVLNKYLARFVTICRSLVSSPTTIPSVSGLSRKCCSIAEADSPIAE